MKNLVIHPKDQTTDFLSQIYVPLKDKTVIRGSISKSELLELIVENEKIIMLGHGSPSGLLSRGQFIEAGQYIVDESMVLALKEKSYCMFIWCYANQFVQMYGLSGLCSGMFISELGEADYWGFEDIYQSQIDQSNRRFSSVVSKNINEPLGILYQSLLYDYGSISKTNPIAKF